MRKFKFGYSGLVVALVLGAAVAPAQGAAAETVETDLPHCAVEIFALGQSDESAAGAVCFETHDEVAAYLAGTAGRGGNASNRAGAASVAVGTIYRDAGGAGGSLTFFGSSGCAGVTFGFPTLASGWDNSISSMRATNGCWGTMYTGTNYGGATLNCTPYCSTIGSWNDSVKSLVFRPSGSLG